ncbi:MAG: hypothetical protein PHC46_01935 [Clostridia bacterium]|nr:hypothetical protein [Clostridia bacterium]
MEVSEIISLVVALASIFVSGSVSIFTIKYFNSKGHIYEIKKNAIIRSLRLIDDYMSSADWIDKKNIPVKKNNLSTEYLTVESRECYNELILTVKNAKLIYAFNRIVFSKHYNKDGIFNCNQMQEYRLLCRKELGIKKIRLENEITFINSVGNNLNKNNF